MPRGGRSPDNAAREGLFGRPKVESSFGRDWPGATAGELAGEPSACVRWHRGTRLKAFREGGRMAHDTIGGRRERLGPAA